MLSQIQMLPHMREKLSCQDARAVFLFGAEELIKCLVIASILQDVHVQCAHLTIDVGSTGLMNDILDGINDKLRLHKDGALHSVAASPHVCAIVQLKTR